MDDYENIRGAKLLVVIGHSEYWTRTARLNFDRFVDEGCHALVLSGNTMWWQVRYSENKDRMICYKGGNDPAAPASSPLRTTNWFVSSLKYSILSSIGADTNYGGFGFRYPDLGWDGMRIVSASSPIFKGLNVENGDILPLRTSEYDGAPLSGFAANGDPVIDNVKLGFYRVDLIGFDRGFYKVDTTATWMVFQKKPASGFVLNGASTDWGSANGIGGSDKARIKIIVRNMMDLLLQDVYPI